MRKLLKTLSIVLAVIMFMGILAGCGKPSKEDVSQKGEEGASKDKEDDKDKTDDKEDKDETPKDDTGFPIVEEPITLKIMARYRTGMAEFKDMITWQKYEELSNINIEWDMVETQTYQEKRNLALATGELPDAFLKCGFNDFELVKYGEQGTFIPLNDLIEEHAPNYHKLLQDSEGYPGLKEAVTMMDGSIYSFVYVAHKDFDSLLYGKIFLNRVWLDALDLEMPSTTDEFYEVLKAFKNDDPNGNNEKDEIPMWAQGSFPVSWFKGAWGLNNRGSAMSTIDLDPQEEDKLRFVPTDPRYKELLEYSYKLYNEGLIDEELFTTDLADLLAKGEEDRIGSFSAAGNTFVGPEHQDDFEGLEVALKGPNGDQLWASAHNPARSTGSFVITSDNKYPEETIKWVDYFYTEEGMRLLFLGEEGLTYEVTADGEYEFTELITDNPKGLDFQQAINQYLPYGVGDNPALLSPKYFKGTETLPIPTEAAKRMKPYAVEESWAPFKLTSEENDRMVVLKNDIETYINEKTTEFITGKASFSEWDEYIKTLERMGLEEYMEIYQRAYDRTYKK